MAHFLLDFIDDITTPPPPPTPLQRIRAVVFYATFLFIAGLMATCCVVGLAVVLRALARVVIG